MNLIKSLSENELQNITDYITRFHNPSEDNEVGEDRCPTEHFLRFWDRNKENLFKMFGEKFILTKNIRYEVEDQDVIEMMLNEIEEVGSPFQEFESFFWDTIDNNPAFSEMDDWNKSIIKRLFNAENLANNSFSKHYYTDVTIPIGDKTIVISRNSDIKIMKVFKKFAEVYGGMEVYEKMRLRHSLILNQKKLTGRLSLSIHPLDYMTMSDNACDWSSCMNWTEGGEYHAGTIEMMNSEYVVVAYLSANCDMDLRAPWTKASKNCSTSWSNKKWRELFIVSDDVISEIKGYPYQSDVLSRIVLEWLKELKTTNSSVKYSDSLCALTRTSRYAKITGVEEALENTENSENLGSSSVETSDIRVNFYTNAMYNDFHTKDYHLMYINQNIIDSEEDYKEISICYSGESECVWCGRAYEVSDASRIMCDHCIARGVMCSCCECYYDEEDIYFVDGDAYCTGCYDEYTATDVITEDAHAKSDMYQVYVIKDEAYNNYSVTSSDIVGYFYTSKSNKDSFGFYGRRQWERLLTCSEIDRVNITLVNKYSATTICFAVRESDIADELNECLYFVY